jgi:hypothetical protein
VIVTGREGTEFPSAVDQHAIRTRIDEVINPVDPIDQDPVFASTWDTRNNKRSPLQGCVEFAHCLNELLLGLSAGFRELEQWGLAGFVSLRASVIPPDV